MVIQRQLHATTPAHVRTESRIVHNTIAIQTGYDSAAANIRFYWSGTSSNPDAFFQRSDPSRWYWPRHGVRIGNTLLIFLAVVEATSGGLGFQGVGWQSLAIDNPDADPTAWLVRYLNPVNAFGLTVGVSVMLAGGYVYAYASPSLQPGPVYLARWPSAAAPAGDLVGTEWYASAAGWIAQTGLSGAPTPIMSNGQSEFNVYPGTTLAPLLEIQTDIFGGASLAYRTAASLTGAWPGIRTFYQPPDVARPNILIYAAKMHPMLVHPGADLIVSYSAETTDFPTLVADTSLGYPRMLKVRWVANQPI